ncbi:hypothetical protein [Alteromonas antoniana]|uniref:hypothetical protein n=1 Tax=Alteromonas antoniana TaxID=2803813 RepID=UPI001C440E9C|nr:hypothetical protein [Alteromonas antoniana]
MKKEIFSAVICLVGARLLSRHDAKRYTKWIHKFQQCVKDRVCVAQDGCTYFFLGEYCYINSEDLESLLDAVRQIRLSLLQEQVYCNAIVVDGGSGINEHIYQHTGERSDEDVANLRSHFFGINFFEESSHLRPEVEDMRAIGCAVKSKNSLITEGQSRQKFFPNVNISTNNHRVDIFKDIAFADDAFSIQTLQSIVQDFFYFTAFSKSISRYFLPLFLNLIQSMYVNEFQHKRKILKVLSSNQFVSKLYQTIGAEYVIFKILHVITQECEQEVDDIAEDDNFKSNRLFLLKFIFRRSALLAKLETLPEFVMPREMRQVIVADYAKQLYEDIHVGKM